MTERENPDLADGSIPADADFTAPDDDLQDPSIGAPVAIENGGAEQSGPGAGGPTDSEDPLSGAVGKSSEHPADAGTLASTGTSGAGIDVDELSEDEKDREMRHY